MSDNITITIDGVEIPAKQGQTIMQAADDAGVYIPRLCAYNGLEPHGSCRVCTIKINGRFQAACTQPVAPGAIIENETDEINDIRKSIVEMFFVEGNHFCMFCEKSGNCELQALAYRLKIPAPRYPFLWPDRQVDASHPDVIIDKNRCVLCGRCVRASKDLDGKDVFGFVGRGPDKQLAIDATARLVDTDLDVRDKAIDACPVGSIMKKRVGFAIPIGQRKYDKKPIGSDIEDKNK